MVLNDYYLYQNLKDLIEKSNLLGNNADHNLIPHTDQPLWILGQMYSTLHDKNEIRSDIQSKILFTYRKNFPKIGGTGPTSDSGWGCMLRCGQMVLAQALIRKHLGRGWKWNPEGLDPVYLKILQMFQDKKECIYSIHQIAQMGQDEGKKVGQWFGPNTVAQVLRKLSTYDEWTNLRIHIALDNSVFIDDLRTLCRISSSPISRRCGHAESNWRPLLLFIPLRLGLSELNCIYNQALRRCFRMKQSLGIIGGKPKHALYCIGITGNEVIYLDPHMCRDTVCLDSPNPDDSTFHCTYGGSGRMKVSEMDPSLALCFYFESEDELDLWSKLATRMLISSDNQPLFELKAFRPTNWPRPQTPPFIISDINDFTIIEKVDDEAYEIL